MLSRAIRRAFRERSWSANGQAARGHDDQDSGFCPRSVRVDKDRLRGTLQFAEETTYAIFGKSGEYDSSDRLGRY